MDSPEVNTFSWMFWVVVIMFAVFLLIFYKIMYDKKTAVVLEDGGLGDAEIINGVAYT